MFWKVIMKSGAEVPWLFKVSRVDDLSRSRVSINANVNVTKQKQTPKLTKVLGGAIDFRSLNNYFFPWDVVSVRLIQDVPPDCPCNCVPTKSNSQQSGIIRWCLEPS